MSNASTLKRIKSDRKPLQISFDGELIDAFEGDSIAAALLGAGYRSTRRTPVSATARAPYCMMGVCFECLVCIDGVANRQACMVEAVADMKVTRMEGARELVSDSSIDS